MNIKIQKIKNQITIRHNNNNPVSYTYYQIKKWLKIDRIIVSTDFDKRIWKKEKYIQIYFLTIIITLLIFTIF